MTMQIAQLVERYKRSARTHLAQHPEQIIQCGDPQIARQLDAMFETIWNWHDYGEGWLLNKPKTSWQDPGSCFDKAHRVSEILRRSKQYERIFPHRKVLIIAEASPQLLSTAAWPKANKPVSHRSESSNLESPSEITEWAWHLVVVVSRQSRLKTEPEDLILDPVLNPEPATPRRFIESVMLEGMRPVPAIFGHLPYTLAHFYSFPAKRNKATQFIDVANYTSYIKNCVVYI